jgi:hypothetical protein
MGCQPAEAHGQSAPARPPRCAASAVTGTVVPMNAYLLPIFDNTGNDAAPGSWTAQDYTLCEALNVNGHYEAEELVQDWLEARFPDTCARVMFNSEFGCFFADGTGEADKATLRTVVADLVAKTNPGATPGSIKDSPAFFTFGRTV